MSQPVSRARTAIVVALAGLFAGVGVAAQEPASLLGARLDPATRVGVERVLDAARADSLPLTPLVNKALEGASKGAPGPRVLAAVQALAGHLGAARRALGGAATEPEIVIGADALRAGAPPQALQELRGTARARSLVVPLAALSVLVGRGVPVDTAVAVVTALARQGVPDRELLAVQRAIERDIGSGVAPGAAAAVHAPARPPAGVPGRGGRPEGPRRPSSRP